MKATLTAYYNREPKELIVEKPAGDWMAFGEFLKSLGFRRVWSDGHPVPGMFSFLTGNSCEFDKVIAIVRAGGEYLTSCNFEFTFQVLPASRRTERLGNEETGMTKVETETGKMITALRDGLHGLHLARIALVDEARELRIAGRKAEREAVWSRVEEITAQIETTNRELAEHMLRDENEAARWTELIPCPFCGGVAKPTFGMDENWCFCTVCGAAGPFHGTRQESVDAWNTRTAYMPDDR